ncbi:MAG: PEP-CTERM sorting domain-containing protein [Burkholderiaceae bacterium]
MRALILSAAVFLSASTASAGVIITRDAAAIAAFQNDLTVLDFEGPTPLGRTPQAINSYSSGQPVDAAAQLFNQAPGVQFSVGGTVGVNMPAIYKLEGSLAGDAASGSNVLGPVSFEFTTAFERGVFLEVYFPTKVSKVGFWINGQLDDVTLMLLNTNFAFSREDEELLQTAVGEAGFFIGVDRATADIGGLKLFGRGEEGFTIDDFSFGSTATVPEPGSLALLATGLALVWRVRRRPQAS